MHSQDWFETQLMIAADEARRMGFDHTNLALLDVLRAALKVSATPDNTRCLQTRCTNSELVQ